MSNLVTVEIVNHSPFPNPAYQTPYSAGMDLHANISEAMSIYPGERELIATGISIALPIGFEAQIRPRSGLALKHGITVLNSPGTIDADYRGEIKVVLINLGKDTFQINPGDRIAQMVVAQYASVAWNAAESLDSTLRGEGGYGSTKK